MSNDLNSVHLSGRLVKDAEVKYTGDGKVLCSFSLAVNDYLPSAENNSYCNFLDIVIWGKRAEAVHNYLTKGKRILIVGKIKQERWEHEGAKKNKIKIIASEIIFIDSVKKDGNNSNSNFLKTENNFPDFSNNEENLNPDNKDEDVPF